MKKRLEAELISIAHRILKLKNKSELLQLYTESRKLYETLSVLKFVEDNIHAIQPKISDPDIEKMIDNDTATIAENDTFELDLELPIEEKVVDNFTADEVELTANVDMELHTQEIEVSAVDEAQANELIDNIEAVEPEIKVLEPQNIFEPLLDYSAEFVKKETTEPEEKVDTQTKAKQISFEDLLDFKLPEPKFEKKLEPAKPATLNEKLSKNSTFGLNDKIGFIKYLFDGSEEDFNRVVSQTGTLDDAEEVTNFVNDLVKPDYNNWENKEDYEARFMEMLLSRFS